MAVNLMAGKLDENENNKNSIDLNLERPVQIDQTKTEVTAPEAEKIKISAPRVEDRVDEAPREKKTIKINTPAPEGFNEVPSDIMSHVSKSKESKGTSIVLVVIVLLIVGVGVLLVLLNSESQFLKGSVNELPTSDVTQIVDSILSQEFSNSASTSTTSTPVNTTALESNQTTTNTTQTNTSNSTTTLDQTNTQQELPVQTEPIVSDTSTPEVVNTPVEVLPVVATNTELEILNSAQETVINSPVNSSNIMEEYNLGTEVVSLQNQTELNQANSSNDFNQETPNVIQLNQPEVLSESGTIQGETGPALWLSVIIATLISYHVRKKKHI